RQPHLCRGSPDRAGRPRAGFHPRHARQPPGRRRSMSPRRMWLGMSAVLLGGAVAVVVAQQDMSKVEIKTEKLADDVWVLYGAGGNIGLCSGPDGALLIDDQFAPLSDKILAAVKAANDAPLRWVVNTHWHGDHVGGNEAMAAAGATLIAQDRVRQRMMEGQDN